MSLALNPLMLLRRGIIVSCQAGPESPLNAAHFIAALAQSAQMGGAAGFRVDRPENVAAVRAISHKPIIGINKQPSHDWDVYITPTFASARAVVEAGATIVALDATDRPRPEPLAELIGRIHNELKVPVMADIGNVREALQAEALGADVIASTLVSTPPYGQPKAGPGFAVIQELVQKLRVPLIVEGQLWSPEDVRHCYELGVHSVVIGSAITVPQFITARFVQAIPHEPAELEPA